MSRLMWIFILAAACAADVDPSLPDGSGPRTGSESGPGSSDPGGVTDGPGGSSNDPGNDPSDPVACSCGEGDASAPAGRGTVCFGTVGCPSGEGCYQDARQSTGTCAPYCDPEDIGSQGHCPSGYLCAQSPWTAVSGEYWPICEAGPGSNDPGSDPGNAPGSENPGSEASPVEAACTEAFRQNVTRAGCVEAAEGSAYGLSAIEACSELILYESYAVECIEALVSASWDATPVVTVCEEAFFYVSQVVECVQLAAAGASGAQHVVSACVEMNNTASGALDCIEANL